MFEFLLRRHIPDTALIQASEIDRLGPGPRTLSTIDPMAADWVPVAVADPVVVTVPPTISTSWPVRS